MENITRIQEVKDNQEKFDKLIGDLNTNIVVSQLIVGRLIHSSYYKSTHEDVINCAKFKHGKFNNNDVTIDGYIKISDLRIFDDSGNVLLDLSDHGYDMDNILY